MATAVEQPERAGGRHSVFFVSAVVLASSAPVSSMADVIYDSKGFEEFTEGFIDGEGGQDGWYGFDEGVWPWVFVGAPSQGSKSVWLQLNYVHGGLSGMYRYTDDLIAEGYVRVTASFDVYREPQNGWIGDLWWSWPDYGDPSGGGQYNFGNAGVSRTYPFTDRDDPFTDDSWVDTRLDAWAGVELTWDIQAGLAYGYYDGVLVGTKHIDDVGVFQIFSLLMFIGTAPEDFHWESAWIDNFIITAEKGACYPDCDLNGALDLFDFLCFVNRFNAGIDYADCDASGALDLFDFLCFVNAFNAGC